MGSRARRRRRDKALTPAAVARAGGRTSTPDVPAPNMPRPDVPGDPVPAYATLLPRPQSWYTGPFGPGRPLDPFPVNPARPDTGRPEPRLWEAPVSWNLGTANTDRLIPWAALRRAADFSLIRRCIQIRKGMIQGLDWDITISPDALEEAQEKADRAARSAPADPTAEPTAGGSTPASASTAAVTDEMRERLTPEINRLKTFMKRPDQAQGRAFETWIGAAYEELAVLDALVVYPRRTIGGDVCALEIVDGSTIKPLLDERGGRPQPPYPAYQQLLYGFVRGEWTASVTDAVDEETGEPIEVIDGAFPADEMVYLRQVDRVWTPYGLSPVEQSLEDASLYLKRKRWMMAEYTDGTTVAGMFTTAEATNWSPEQLLEYEVAFNAAYGGDDLARHSARFLPTGVVPVHTGLSGSDAIAERYRPDYDLWLLKTVVMHFGVTLPELGFTDAAAGGLGAAGYHEGQEEVQLRKRKPDIQFLEAALTWIMRTFLGAPEELKFSFLGLDDDDEPGAAELDLKKQAGGVITLNELRDKNGLARYTFPEADMALLVTARGIEVIEGAAKRAEAGQMQTPEQAPPPGTAAPGAPQPGGGGQPVPGAPSGAGSGQPDASQPQGEPTGSTAAQKLAELEAYRRFVKKRQGAGRPFRFEHHSAAEVADLVKAGGAAPKARSPWPGWSRDLQVAEHYQPLLSRALTGAVGARELSARWTESARIASVDVARAWMPTALADRIQGALTPVIHRLWTEGYLVGDVASAFMVRQLGPRPAATKFSRIVNKASSSELEEEFDHAVEWGDWTPGDARVAAAILNGSGRYAGLRQMLESGDLTIRSIAVHRVEELARVLSEAADGGWSAGKTERALRDVLTDPQWARMVAITEVSRASSAASLAQYARNGVDGKDWMTAADQRVCPECHENEAQGPIPAKDYFQDGSDAPPGHPICRCAIAPDWLADSAPGSTTIAGLELDLEALDLSD